MIGFVLENACQPAFGFNALGFAMPVEALQCGINRAHHFAQFPGDREATFYAGIHLARGVDNLGVDKHIHFGQGIFIVFVAKFGHEKPLRQVHLWGRQPHSGRIPHRLNHVVN